MFLTELAEPTLLVIYPGRFQPFHRGHAQVFQYLTGKFGRNNVYITTSNKTDNLKSPFTFSEKSYFMQLTGVPADRIIQASQPYQIENILQCGQIQVADPNNTVVIFAVSQKDMEEDPRFSFAPKKDGSTPYFQPLKDIKQTESMSKHGYIMTVPTFDFKVLGQPMQSGTELRKMYGNADRKQRQQIIAELFGKYTAEAEQIMNAKIPSNQPAQEPAALPKKTKLQKVKQPTPVDYTDYEYSAESIAEDSTVDPQRKNLLAKARVAHPFAKSDEEALALYISNREAEDFGRVEDEEHNLEARVDDIEQKLQQLLNRPVTEAKRKDRPLPNTNLQVGDRVVADLRKEKNYPTTQQFVSGFVTRIGEKGVHIDTDDGTNEWHPYKIVKKLGLDEDTEQLSEAPARDILLGLLDKFYADMKLPPRDGYNTGLLSIKPPGTKVWTRGDGIRHRDPGRFEVNYFSDKRPTAERALAKFWPWLIKQPFVKPIGQISGEFGNDPMKDAVSYKGLYFTYTGYYTCYGSLSRIKNPRSVWRNTPPKANGIAEADLAWLKDRLSEGAVDTLTARHIEYINQDIDALKQRISTEKLPTQYVETLKQKIAKLEAERAKLAF